MENENSGTKHDVMKVASSSPRARWLSKNGGAEYWVARRKMSNASSLDEGKDQIVKSAIDAVHRATTRACRTEIRPATRTLDPPVNGVAWRLMASEG